MDRACWSASLVVLQLAAGGCGRPSVGSGAAAGTPTNSSVIGLRAGTFTPSGDTLYLTLRSAEGHYSAIAWSTRAGSGWTSPRIAAVSGRFNDFDPAGSPDGRWLLFTSIYRPDELLAPGVPYNRGDLYLSEAGPAGWGPPRHLGAPINSAAVDCCATWSRDGRLVYFSSERNFITEADSV